MINSMLGNSAIHRIMIFSISRLSLNVLAKPNNSGYNRIPELISIVLMPGGSENKAVHSRKKAAMLSPERELAYRMPIYAGKIARFK
ncbi:hypothetical protein D3C73_1363460 [compost metagenome]